MGRSVAINVFVAAACVAILLLSSSAPADAPSVKVLRSIPFTEDSGATENVKNECRLDTRVPEFLSEFSDRVELVDELGKAGRVLTLQISQVHAPGGGGFSGPKIVTVKGTLRDGDEKIGSFTATRYSTGGMFGGYKGTCAIVGRCAKTIGRDIAEWLKSPQDGAKLGDA